MTIPEKIFRETFADDITMQVYKDEIMEYTKKVAWYFYEKSDCSSLDFQTLINLFEHNWRKDEYEN